MGDIVLTTTLTNDDEIVRRAKRRKLLIHGIGVTVSVVVVWYNQTYLERGPREDNDLERRSMLRRLYNGTERKFYSQLLLTKKSFHKLCSILREKGGLEDTNHVTVEEALAMLLNILGQDTKYCVVTGYFIRFGETISRHFGIILREILKLGKDYIKGPDPNIRNSEDGKWKWFKDSLGALDGTYVSLTVPVQDQGRYRNRKQQIATNVLGVCDPRMKFIYVLPGWEGSASDSRILRNALTRSQPFVVPAGKYYLVNARYTNGPGFLAPYRSTRYHLNEWAASGSHPTNYKELFNLRHASARNVIERTFGLLKKRWAILRGASFFDVKTQVRIINACCILHNFIRDEQEDLDARLLIQVDRELAAAEVDPEEINDEEVIKSVQVTQEWTNFRDYLAHRMFAEYQARRGV